MFKIVKECNKVLIEKFKFDYLFFSICLILSSLLSILGIASLGPVLIMILNPDEFINLIMKIELINFSSDYDYRIIFIYIFLVFNFLSILLDFIVSLYGSYFSKKINLKLRLGYFEKIFSIMPDQILSINKIKLNNVLGAELSRFETIIRSYLTLIQSSFIIVSLIIFTYLINEEIIVLIFFPILFFILIIVFFKKKLTQISKKITHINASFNKFNLSFNMGFKDFVLLDIKNKILQNYKSHINENIKLILKENLIFSFPRYFFQIIFFLIVSYLFYYSNINNLSATELAKITLILYSFYKLLPWLVNFYKGVGQFYSNKNAFENTNKFYKELKKLKKLKKSKKTQIKEFTKNLNIKLSNVVYKYPNSNKEFKYNLDIYQGSNTLIYGESGIGKSTLLNLLSCFSAPVSGKFMVGKKNIEKVKNYYLKNISIVQQNFLIFPETISYNISFKNNLDYYEKIWIKKIYDICGIVNVEKNYKNIFIKKFNISAPEISGGQRQRLSIARSIFKKPKILFIDEGFNALDKKSEIEILKKIRKYLKNITIVYVTHRPIKKFFNKKIQIKQ